MTVNGTASVTATVSNDSANAGVTWSCAPSGSCGSFNPTNTASATATNYTAPATVPTGNVTITATSVTDGTKSSSATVTINPVPLADGSYVFSVGGNNVNGVYYNVAGVFTLSGGIVTTGEQDYVDANNSDLHDSISPAGSFVTTTSDNNLQITLAACQGQIVGTTCTLDTVIGGGLGSETFNGSIINSSTCGTAGGPCRARIIEFDLFATSSGTLELQDGTAVATAPTGAYAFGVQGVPGLAHSVGGIVNISGTTVSTTGTVFDLNNGGTVLPAETISSGSVTAPDAMGRFQVSITPSDPLIPILSFASYIVDANHTQLLQATLPLSGTAFSVASGATASGNSYVVGLTGYDIVGPMQAAGVVTLAQGATGVTGTISYNDLANLQSAAIPITGTYTPDATNAGRYTLNVSDGTNTFDLAFYIDGRGNAIEVSTTTGLVLEGIGAQQATGTFSGTYAMTATGFDGSNAPFEFDAVGPVATGSNTFASPGSVIDLNWLGTNTTTPGMAVSGAFTTPSASGVSTGAGNTLTGLDVLLGPSQADALDYYQVDANTVIGIEIDSNQNTLATFDLTQ